MASGIFCPCTSKCEGLRSAGGNAFPIATRAPASTLSMMGGLIEGCTSAA